MSDKTNELVDRVESEHQRVALYRDAELYCPWIDDEEHDEDRHMQAASFSSSIICLDLPAGEGCETCSTDNLCESLELVDVIKRLQGELIDTHQRYHDRFSRIAEGWRKRRMERIRSEKEKAWDACADKAYELDLTEEQRDELLAANPYRKEEN